MIRFLYLIEFQDHRVRYLGRVIYLLTFVSWLKGTRFLFRSVSTESCRLFKLFF